MNYFCKHVITCIRKRVDGENNLKEIFAQPDLFASHMWLLKSCKNTLQVLSTTISQQCSVFCI